MNDWFSWNGVKCTEYGIHVLEQPPITIPAERATFTNIPGRPGSLTTLEGDDVYDDLILTAQCMISDPSNIRTIATYLKGSGKVAFANRPGGFYFARIVNQIPFEKRNFPSSFADAFDMLMKKNGDTRETIAEKLNVNSKSLQRWLKEPDRRINADFIVLLALTWRLPDWISALLLDRAYIQLSESNRRHLALQYILKVLWSEGIENANAYLTARKLDCLSI